MGPKGQTREPFFCRPDEGPFPLFVCRPNSPQMCPSCQTTTSPVAASSPRANWPTRPDLTAKTTALSRLCMEFATKPAASRAAAPTWLSSSCLDMALTPACCHVKLQQASPAQLQARTTRQGCHRCTIDLLTFPAGQSPRLAPMHSRPCSPTVHLTTTHLLSLRRTSLLQQLQKSRKQQTSSRPLKNTFSAWPAHSLLYLSPSYLESLAKLPDRSSPTSSCCPSSTTQFSSQLFFPAPKGFQPAPTCPQLVTNGPWPRNSCYRYNR